MNQNLCSVSVPRGNHRGLSVEVPRTAVPQGACWDWVQKQVNLHTLVLKHQIPQKTTTKNTLLLTYEAVGYNCLMAPSLSAVQTSFWLLRSVKMAENLCCAGCCTRSELCPGHSSWSLRVEYVPTLCDSSFLLVVWSKNNIKMEVPIKMPSTGF